jgi:myo-inositol-1(or 4)-monophosphatase
MSYDSYHTLVLKHRSAIPTAIEKPQKMTPNYIPAAVMLRGITDKIARYAQTTSGKESIAESINRVRDVSKQAQAQMRSALGAAFPEIAWSESEDKRDRSDSSAPYWVYDPIDGAYHYLQGLPLWSSSLALVKDGHAILGLVYDPCNQELFVAETGRGTSLNGQSICASAKTDLRAAVVGTALPPFGSVAADEHASAVALLVETSKQVFVIRQMAAASLQLAYVAAGRLDAYVETGDDVYDWLAGCLLVQEAGGEVTALNGTYFDVDADGVVAAAAGLHHTLRAGLKSVSKAGV